MDDIELLDPCDRLKWARQRAGYEDAAAFADALGLKAVTYRAYENGQNGFAKYAPLFAPRLGVTVEWLLSGGVTPTGAIPARGRSIRRLPSQAAPEQVPTIPAEDETVEISQVDLSFSMGAGTTVDDYVEETPVRFDMNFLRSITKSPFHRLRLARGVGDSMFPTLVPGDTVLFDTTQRSLNMQDKVYAISLFGAAAIKRLRAVGAGRVVVKSDNPAVDDQEVDLEDVMIAGRVIWFGREL